MEHNMKEVYFNQHCGKCKHSSVVPTEEPCNECLTTPVNLNSHVPIKYEDDK